MTTNDDKITAAAKHLYVACKNVAREMRLWARCDPDNFHFGAELARLDWAIAKAEGKKMSWGDEGGDTSECHCSLNPPGPGACT